MSFSFSLDVALPPNEWERIDFNIVVNRYAAILRSVLNQNKDKLPDDLETRAQMDNRGPSIHDYDFDVTVDDPEDPTKIIISHPVEHMPLLYYGNTPGNGTGTIHARKYRPQRSYAFEYNVFFDQASLPSLKKYGGATLTDDYSYAKPMPVTSIQSGTHKRIHAKFTRTGTSVSSEPMMVFYNKKVGHWMMKSEVRGNASVVPIVRMWFSECEAQAHVILREEMEGTDLIIELNRYKSHKKALQRMVEHRAQGVAYYHREARKYPSYSKDFAENKVKAGEYYVSKLEVARERDKMTRKIRETKKKLRDKGYKGEL